MGTFIKHPVPDRVKPSFVIFDIRALPVKLCINAYCVVLVCLCAIHCHKLATFADVAHPLLMAGKSTMPAFIDGKYTHVSPVRPVQKRAQKRPLWVILCIKRNLPRANFVDEYLACHAVYFYHTARQRDDKCCADELIQNQ